MNSTEIVKWFPMRITYNRELKIKNQLDKLKIENFLPMRYDLVETKCGRQQMLVPAIHNLIFVHSTQKDLTYIKNKFKEFEPMRFIMSSILNGNREILYIPERQMDNFMKVASVQDDTIKFLDNNSFISQIGKSVRITAGQFKGVIGTIRRIKKNKYVVVQINGLAAVAITYIPSRFLEMCEHS